MIGVSALAALPLMLADSGTASFPSREITRATSEWEWPFSVDAGELTCVALQSHRGIIFSEPWPDYDLAAGKFPYLPRSISVSTNPVVLVLLNLRDKSLLAPFDTLETLVRRMAPYELLGSSLCDEAKEKP